MKHASFRNSCLECVDSGFFPPFFLGFLGFFSPLFFWGIRSARIWPLIFAFFRLSPQLFNAAALAGAPVRPPNSAPPSWSYPGLRRPAAPARGSSDGWTCSLLLLQVLAKFQHDFKPVTSPLLFLFPLEVQNLFGASSSGEEHPKGCIENWVIRILASVYTSSISGHLLILSNIMKQWHEWFATDRPQE